VASAVVLAQTGAVNDLTGIEPAKAIAFDRQALRL